MKIFIFLLLSLLVVEANYAEQRLWDTRPGVPCNKIPEVEKHLGSFKLDTQDGKGISKYMGTQGGRKATIIYRCDKGRLSEKRIIVTSSSRDEAYRFANEQKIKMTKQFGTPIHDGLDMSIWKRLYFGFVGADLDYLISVVVWGRAKEDSMLLIKETGNNRWEVSISQGSSKSEYIFNS
jgi:hypothetical protein